MAGSARSCCGIAATVLVQITIFGEKKLNNEVSLFLDQQKFELAQRSAKALSSSTMIPREYQGNIPNTLIAMDIAIRMRMPPLMVMQNLYIVHGKPGWSAKFLIASFNTSGRFSPISYTLTGEPGKDTYGCIATSKDLSTGELVKGPEITMGIAKAEGWYDKNGSKWKTIPELMLRYRAGSWLINTIAPDISVGLATSDEIQDGSERDITPQPEVPVATDINSDLGLIGNEGVVA